MKTDRKFQFLDKVDGASSFDEAYKHFPVAVLDESFRIVHTSRRMMQIAEAESFDLGSKGLTEVIFESDRTFPYVLPN